MISINDILEAFSNRAICFNKINTIAGELKEHYIDSNGYNFIVENSGVERYLIKYFTNNDTQQIRNSLELIASFENSPFLYCEWLKDELDIYKSPTDAKMADLAIYDISYNSNYNYFLSILERNENSLYIANLLKSLFDVMIWLDDAGISISSALRDSLVIVDDKFHISIVKTTVREERDDQSLIKLLSEILSKFNIKELITPENLKSTLSKYAGEVDDLLNYNRGINCFANPRYELDSFKDENRIIVTDSKTSLKGYASTNGTLVIPCKYEIVTPFVEGYAVVQQNSLAGVIDRDDNIIIEFNYDWIEWEWIENKFRVCKDNRWSLLDRNLTKLTDKFDYIESFVSGFAVVSDDGLEGVINASGETLINLQYDEIRNLKNGKLYTRIDEKEEIIFIE